MEKAYKQIIGLYSIMLFFCTNSIIGQVQREGLLSHITNYPADISTTVQYPLERKENKIWFLDSCVIWQQRVNYRSEESTDSGTIVKTSYPVSKYVYFDLRTGHCQDYLSLKDTATPFRNYYVTNTDIYCTFYNFFFPKYTVSLAYPYDSLDVIYKIADTIIENTIFKRAVRLRKTYAEGYVRDSLYFSCNMPQTIFHIGTDGKKLENIYPGCQIVKNELVFDSSGIKIGGEEYEIIRDKLTKEERNIFTCWQLNSKKTILPLIPYSEVLKLVDPSPEHENPKISLIPREN